MRYLTKDWYLMSQQYPMPEEVQEKVHDAWKAFREAQAREDIPRELAGRLSLHDGDVTGVVMGEDCVLAVDSPYSGNHRITFRNAVPGPEQPAEGRPWVWIYDELYRTPEGGYEAHILLQSDCGPGGVTAADLCDLVIVCSEIQIQ